MDQYDDSLPRARAGHCSVAVSFYRCYILAFFVFLFEHWSTLSVENIIQWFQPSTGQIDHL